MNNTDKRRILYARTLGELKKQIKFQEKAAYVPISEVKYYEERRRKISLSDFSRKRMVSEGA